MKVIQNIIKVDNYNYFIKHLEILNILLPVKLANKEIKVLASFMSQDKSLIEDDMFNGVVRKKVMEQIKISPGGLGNHLKAMLDKGFLSKHKITKRITVKDYLIPEVDGQGYQIKLKKDDIKK